MAQLTALVGDTLRRLPDDVTPLAQLVFDKTGGNPFFAVHFLTTLYREGLLAYSTSDATWRWDLAAIRRQGFTDNVVELMLGRQKRLPVQAQKALMLAACIGSTIDGHTLALLTDRTEAQLDGILQEAVDEGLLSRLDSGYTFLHDRVQEAAYNLLPPEQRPGRHLQIGRTLLAHARGERLADNIFDIVGQLNRGASLITSATEKVRLAELNLIAGRRAKAATAFASARTYLVAGTELLSSAAWDSSYELAFTLHVEHAECEYLVGDYGRSEELLALALAHARRLLDRVRVHRLYERLYEHSGRWPEAMSAALKGLELLGVSFPDSDEDIRDATEAEIGLIQVNLNGRSIADLADEPFAEHVEVRVVVPLLAEALSSCYVVRPLLLPLLAARGVNRCLQRGHVEESPFLYSCYSMVLVGSATTFPLPSSSRRCLSR